MIKIWRFKFCRREFGVKVPRFRVCVLEFGGFNLGFRVEG
jgi:hypothetical protein